MSKVIWRNQYYDKDYGYTVEFVDIKTGEYEEYRYYLFYKVGNKSFHSPLEALKINQYDLEIINIDNLNTFGEDVSKLISAQFCDKVISMISNQTLKGFKVV